jgi:hypothetical protein
VSVLPVILDNHNAVGRVAPAPAAFVDGETVIPVDVNNPLPVTISGGVSITGDISAATEYSEDAAAPANPTGGMVLARRRDTLSGAEVSADGDVIAVNATAKGELTVHDADLLAALPAALGGNGGLKIEGVAGGTAVPVSAASLPLPSGAATETTIALVATEIGATNESAASTDTATAGLNGRLQRIAQRLTSLIGLLPTALGANGGLKIEGVASGTVVPVSAASLPLPSGAATESTLSGISTTIGTVATEIGATNETAASTDTATAGLNGRLQRIAQRLTSLIALFPASLGSNGGVKVDIVGGSSAGTEYTEDAAAAADPAGGMMIAVRRDTLSTSEVSADGDNIALKATNKGQLHVRDADGDTLRGALTETAPASDTASSGLNGRLQRVAQRLTSLIGLLPTALGANGGLKIEGVASGTAVPVSAASLPLPSGAATESTLSAISGSVDGLETQVGATNETAASTDTATAGLNGRLQRVAQRLTSLIALFPASLGSNGGVKVDIVGGSSAGTEYTEDAAAAADPAGGMMIAVRRDTLSTSEVSADGDNIALKASNKGQLHVRDADADALFGSVTETAPASDTASSGLNGRLQRVAQRLTSLIALFPAALGSNGGVKVDIVGGTNTQYTEDAAAAGDPVGTMMVAVRRDTLSTSEVSADGDNVAMKATNKGQLHVRDADGDTLRGALTETAPTTDTASSGLNGRLQRIAQRLTSLIALVPTALGANGGFKIEGVASGTAVPVSGPMTSTEFLADLRSTGAFTSVNSVASSTTILASNSSRKGAIIVNTDANALYLDLTGGTATTTTRYARALVTGESYEVPFGTTGAITGIWAADGSGAALVTEFS